MKNLLIALVLIVTVLSGCKKDDPVLDREKFIGHWTGTISTTLKMDGDIVDFTTEVNTETIDKGLSENQIILSKGSEGELDATVDGSVITITDQSLYLPNGDGTSIECFVVGQGILSSNNILTISYNMIAMYENIEYEWIMVQTINKN